MTAHVTVTIPVEGEPTVTLWAADWEDEQRLRRWLDGTPYGALVDLASRLAAARRAAAEDLPSIDAEAA